MEFMGDAGRELGQMMKKRELQRDEARKMVAGREEKSAKGRRMSSGLVTGRT